MTQLRFVTTALAALAFSSLALAYVPPSAFLVKKVAEKKRGFSGVLIRTAVTGMNGTQASGYRFRATTVVDYGTRRLKVRAYDEEGHELYAIERDLNSESTPTGALVLFTTAVDPLTRALRTAGLPIRSDQELLAMASEEERRQSEVTSVARNQNDVVWVLGPKGTSKPQLWIEKDQFLPIRLVARRDGSDWDLRFDSYRFTQEFPFPSTIRTYEDGSDPSDLVFREDLLEVTLAPSSKDLRSVSSSGFTDDGNRADSGVRKLISKYFDIAR